MFKNGYLPTYHASRPRTLGLKNYEGRLKLPKWTSEPMCSCARCNVPDVNSFAFVAACTMGYIIAKHLIAAFIPATLPRITRRSKRPAVIRKFVLQCHFIAPLNRHPQRWSFWKAYVGQKSLHLVQLVTTSPVNRCAVTAHLCGEPCQLVGKPGCLQQCAKVGTITPNSSTQRRCFR